jgi:hypothetical protein
MRRERGQVESHGEGESQEITSRKGSSEICPGWADRGGGASASAAVPGRRSENTAGRGLRAAVGAGPPPLPRPSHRAVGKEIFGKASESSVGKLGGNSLFQDRDRRWPFEIVVL